jgi:hypothetical protein
VQDLDADDGRRGRDADGSERVVLGRDDARDVRAVPERAGVLVEGEAGDERGRAGHVQIAVEVLVGAVDAAVEDGHADALTREASRPRRRGFD